MSCAAKILALQAVRPTGKLRFKNAASIHNVPYNNLKHRQLRQSISPSILESLPI